MAVDVSLIIPARNEGALLPATVASMAHARTGLRREVIVVDDGSAASRWRPPLPHPGLPLTVLHTAGWGAAAARNYGAARSRGRWLCFCDAHLGVADGWLDGLASALATTGAAAACPVLVRDDDASARGYGYTWTQRAQVRWLPRVKEPTAVPFLPGGCIFVERAAFAAAGRFDSGLVPWGHEDTDFSLALWLSGHDAVVAPDVLVRHRFRARHPYLVLRQQVDDNVLRVAFVHFRPGRTRRFAAALGLLARLPAIAAQPDAVRRRAQLLAARRRDDDWFCGRFGLDYWD